MTTPTPGSAGVDDRGEWDVLFAVLADENRRQVLRHLQSSAERVVSLDRLVDALLEGDHSQAERDRTATALHHVALPKLAAAGYVDHDPERSTVRYLEQPMLQRVLALTEHVETVAKE